LHCQEIDGGEIKHFSYLAESNPEIDPRIGLIEKMVKQTINANTIFMYSHYEKTMINGLKRDFPAYAKELDHILERLVDFDQRNSKG